MTDTYTQALELQAAYTAELKAIRADKRLSGDGKRHAIARLFARHRDAMTRLQEGQQHANARRRRQLERKLFGVSDSSDTASLSLRDAHERASLSKTPRQALTLLSAAERSGDSVLARAVAAHAWDRGWTVVLDTYASERSGVLNDFQELDDLERQGQGPGLTSSLAFRLTPPQELRGLTEAALRGLAGG